jgi:hypothetical protein
VINNSKAKIMGSVGMPAIALAVYLIGAATGLDPAYAATVCYKDGNANSVGACVSCPGNRGQECTSDGTWGNCGGC